MADKELIYSCFEPKNELNIQGLFEASFSKKMSSTLWRWRFLNNPHGTAIIDLAWDNDLLVGHYAVSKCRLKISDGEFLSGLSGTTMTHPSYRGLGLFPKLAEKTYAKMCSDGLVGVWGFPNANSHRGFVRDLKWLDIYEIPTFRLSISNSINGTNDVDGVREVTSFDENFDDLWKRVHQSRKIMVKRDSFYLQWRYFANSKSKYRVMIYHEKDRLLGYSVFKRYDNEIQIVDLLTMPDVSIGKSLIQQTVNVAIKEGCVAISMWLNVNDPLHHILEQIGFRDDAPITYFGGRIFDEAQGNIFYDYRNWHITMGDSDVY